MTPISKVMTGVAAIAALLAVGCGSSDEEAKGKQPSPREAAPSPSKADRDAVEVFLDGIEAFNENDLEQLVASYAEDAALQAPASGAPPAAGRRAVVRQITGFKGILPHSKIGVRRVFESGGMLVAQFVLTGTRRYDQQGVEMKPEKVGYHGAYFVKAKDGLQQGVMLFYEQSAIRRQLGWMSGDPPPVPGQVSGEPQIVRGEPSEDVEETVRAFYELLESRNFDGLDERIAEGFSFADHSSGAAGGLDEARRELSGYLGGLSEISFDVLKVIAADGWAAAMYVLHGKSAAARGDAGPDAGPDRELMLHGAHVFQLKGDRIASIEVYRSRAERLRQLGKLKETLTGQVSDGEAPSRKKGDAGAD
jgi:ketosteroid isomerase-like protein